MAARTSAAPISPPSTLTAAKLSGTTVTHAQLGATLLLDADLTRGPTVLRCASPDDAFARDLYEALHRHGVTTFVHNASTLRTLDDDERVLLVLWEERHQDQRMLHRV